jgi:hypothetical protein
VPSKYKKYLPETLQEAYVASLEDPDMMALKEEMALLRTMLGKRAEQIDWDDIDAGTIRDITTLVKEVGRVHTNIVDQEYKSRQVIPISMFPVMLAYMEKAIRKVIADERAVAEIGTMLREMPMLPARVEKVE